jgi:GWxTD domain-containing protein
MSQITRRRSSQALGAIFLVLFGTATAFAAAIPKKDIWYTQHYPIMQDFERKLYKDLSEAGRKGFQDLFWTARAPEARAKFEARLDFVMKNFKQENRNQPWNTDRGRVYLLNGSPASIDYDQNTSWAMTALPGGGGASGTDRSNEDVGANRAEIWIYSYDKYFIKYTFAFVQPSQWRITQTTGSRYLGELEDFNKTVTFGVTDKAAYEQALDGLDKKK